MRRAVKAYDIVALFRETDPIMAKFIAGFARGKDFPRQRVLPIRIAEHLEDMESSERSLPASTPDRDRKTSYRAVPMVKRGPVGSAANLQAHLLVGWNFDHLA